MEIENGWRFMAADFSVRAAGNESACGSVTLVRSPDEKEKWHKMSDDMKEADDGPELYVTGAGHTIEEATTNANLKAAHAKPITT